MRTRQRPSRESGRTLGPVEDEDLDDGERVLETGDAGRVDVRHCRARRGEQAGEAVERCAVLLDRGA